MKKYIKDGIIKPGNQIVIKGQRTITDKDGNEILVDTQTFNPKHEDIIADGWEEYITPIYERTIEDYRRDKIHEINQYDSSSEVNEFTVNGIPMWLDKATRVGLKLRFETEIEDGETETTLWYNGVAFPLEINMAVKMLHAIEKYASKCYDNTQRHIGYVNQLENIEDIQKYNYRDGYPEKLTF